MGNISSTGKLDLADLKYLPHDHQEFPDLLLETGDIVFNRTNSAELVGKTACYRGIPSPCSFASYLIRVRLLSGVAPQLIVNSINGGFGRRWIKRVVTQMVGQANVNGTKLAAFTFPLAPEAEQLAIVEAVEEQLSVIDHFEREIETKLNNAQALHQSILRHAFEGKLVPQLPNDEPASELLKRIAAEREERHRLAAAAKAAAKSARFGGKRKPGSSRPRRHPSSRGTSMLETK
jgi:type I restriction enzyme S subunit